MEHITLLEPAPRTKPTKRCRSTKVIHIIPTALVESSSAAIDEIYTFNDDAEEDLCVVDLPTSTIDGPYAVGSSDIVQIKPKIATTNAITATNMSGKMNSKKKRGVRRCSGTSSEEERWLFAIESGKLEEVDDELKKIKDPKLMTARQRAMYERNIDKEPSPGSSACSGIKSLPIESKERILSAEAIEKAQLKSRKRKQMADEKREKNKRETRDRLLKKQETKVTKMTKNKVVVKAVAAPVISYYMGKTGTYVSFPKDFEIPVKTQLPREPPPPIQLCGICNEDKKRYNCSKTNIPLCSMQCYKLNLERQQINQSH